MTEHVRHKAIFIGIKVFGGAGVWRVRFLGAIAKSGPLRLRLQVLFYAYNALPGAGICALGHLHSDP